MHRSYKTEQVGRDEFMKLTGPDVDAFGALEICGRGALSPLRL